MVRREEMDDAVLVDFINHEWFDYFYWETLNREIIKIQQAILNVNAEDEERLYTKTQIDRLLLKVVQKLLKAPNAFCWELQLDKSELLNDIVALKKEFIK